MVFKSRIFFISVELFKVVNFVELHCDSCSADERFHIRHLPHREEGTFRGQQDHARFVRRARRGGEFCLFEAA